MHDVLFAVTIMCLLILLLIFLLKKLKQPYLIAYVIAGIVLGTYVTGIFSDPENIASIFRCLRFPAKDSIYAGALLSQTGEFGLLACSLAYQLSIIDYDFFKSALAITGLSLFLSTIWMTTLRKIIYSNKKLWIQSFIFY